MLHSHEEHVLNGLLNAVSDRQQMLANNLTNVSTPGYVRQDMDFNSVLKDLKNPNSAKSIDKMIEDATFRDQEQPPSFENELAQMSKNQLHYILLTRINGHIYQHLEEATQSGRAA
jgi:flagellar basal-body rod protein FlgB